MRTADDLFAFIRKRYPGAVHLLDYEIVAGGKAGAQVIRWNTSKCGPLDLSIYFGTTDVDSQKAWREAKHYREAIRAFLKSLENEPKA